MIVLNSEAFLNGQKKEISMISKNEVHRRMDQAEKKFQRLSQGNTVTNTI